MNAIVVGEREHGYYMLLVSALHVSGRYIWAKAWKDDLSRSSEMRAASHLPAESDSQPMATIRHFTLAAAFRGTGGSHTLKTLSAIFASTLSFLVPTVGGVIFFFVILGVFGLGFAIAGLLVAVTVVVVILRRLPAEGGVR